MLHVLTVTFFLWPPAFPWREVGRAFAERDIAAGTMRWKIYGHLAGIQDADRVAEVRLRNRFGLEVEVVAQCVLTYELKHLSDGYNDRIQQEVEARHGAGVIADVWAESWQEIRPGMVARDWLLKVVVGAGVVVLLVACRRRLMSRVRARRRASPEGPA
ncbi:MAG TPA: hypothetical protein VH092_05000 [Urbifossiella sp.]|jgi:hypothetical protein|nr:hypothetical protein [Urbifossiella sp.]